MTSQNSAQAAEQETTLDQGQAPKHQGQVQDQAQDQAQDAAFYRRQQAAQIGALLEETMRETAAKLGANYRIAILAFEVELKEGGNGREGTVAGMQFAADVASKSEFVQLLQLAAKVETEQLARERGQKILRPGDREWPGALRSR